MKKIRGVKNFLFVIFCYKSIGVTELTRVQTFYNIINDFFFLFQGSFIHKVAKTVGITNKDTKETEHREQFMALVREVRGVLNAYNCPNLSLTVLPHVNASGK